MGNNNENKIINEFYKPRFKVEIYKKEGNEFENFFKQVMQKVNPEFRNPKPQGKLGDGKCDGFIESTGEFFQIFAPEDISKSKTINYSLKKIEDSVFGIIENWKSFEIKKIYFIINDKFKSVYVSIFDKIKKQDNLQKNISIKLMLMDDFLKLVLDKLSLDDFRDIFGNVPNDDDLLSEPNFKLIIDTINNLLDMKINEIEDIKTNAPPIDEKMDFNKLNDEIKNYLSQAYLDIYLIENYFKKNKIEEEKLKTLFMKTYDKAKKICSNENEIFYYIIEELFKSEKIRYRKEFFILISYYFSYCDIFEEPPEKPKVH
jgi:hypothetical protein